MSIELGNFPPVKSAASIMREIIYNNKNNLSASMICSGWDPYLGEQIYKVNSSGFIESCDIAMSGSGSIFIQSYADTNYKRNFTKEEA